MTAIDATAPVAPRPGLVASLRRMCAWLARVERDAAAARARRAFVQDAVSRNPDAFESDLDVQAMMQHYPGQF
jgi:hypothetical protein